MNDAREFENMHELPEELGPLSAGLRSVGRRDQGAAPVTLEDRVFTRTRGLLHRRGAAPGVAGRIGLDRGRLRLAAMIAVAAVGIAGAAWLIGRAPSGASVAVNDNMPPEILEADVEGVLAAIEFEDEISGELSSLREELAMLEDWDALEESLGLDEDLL